MNNEIIIELVIALGKIVFLFTFLILGAALAVLAERKISAFIQERYGPNRVGPWGIIQPFADVVKLVMKEDIVPQAANRFIHDLAPIISISVALSTFAIIPFGDTMELFGQTDQFDCCRCEYRHFVFTCAYIAWCVWNQFSGMVVQQQIFAAGRIAFVCTIDQL